MRELVFLLEELSAQVMLESLLPRLLDDRIVVRYIPFEGKQDLEKQLTRKIRAYQNPHARFIVLRDQDSHPKCVEVKQRLLHLCAQSKGVYEKVAGSREIGRFLSLDNGRSSSFHHLIAAIHRLETELLQESP